MKRFPLSKIKCVYCERSVHTFDMDKHGRKIMVDYDVFWCPNCKKILNLREIIFTETKEGLHGNPNRQTWKDL